MAETEWLTDVISSLQVELWAHMGVSKNKGTSKWMVMENPIKMDHLGVYTPYFRKNPHITVEVEFWAPYF